MSNTPPRRGEQRPASGGARQSTRPAAGQRGSQPLPPRRAPRSNDQYEPDDQYYEDDQYEQPSRPARQGQGTRNGPPERRPRANSRYDQYDSYERDARPQRSNRQGARGGPPPRRQSARPRYVAPRRDAFPIIMGSLVGAMIVGLLIVVYLLLNCGSGTTTLPATTAGNTAAGQPTIPAQAMAQSTTSTGSTAAQLTMVAARPANGLGTPMPDEGNTHVSDGEAITYKNYPPSSGTHYSTPEGAGFYTSTVAEGNFVHSLEHGYIVLYYKPDLPDATKQQLKALMTTLPLDKYSKVKMVIVPYSTGMTTPLAIAAWDRLLPMSDYNFDVIKTFYQQYVDKGPEDIP